MPVTPRLSGNTVSRRCIEINHLQQEIEGAIPNDTDQRISGAIEFAAGPALADAFGLGRDLLPTRVQEILQDVRSISFWIEPTQT